MISVAQLRELEKMFAEPEVVCDVVVWRVPAWLAYLQQKLRQPVMPCFYTCWKDSQ